MTTATLTPLADQTPAVANVTKELSGTIWTQRFPGSASTAALTPIFRPKVEAFINAILAAGGHKDISNTFRPEKRAYMMHWAYRIYRQNFDPSHVPPMAGVNIEWVHDTLEESILAAKNMCDNFGIQNLGVAPALQSLHCTREAVDMRIWWAGDLNIQNGDGSVVTIDTLPRSGMNDKLKEVGASYGVYKFIGGATDKPHWSKTGN